MSRTKGKATKRITGEPIGEVLKIVRHGDAYNKGTSHFFHLAARWTALFSTLDYIKIYRKKGFEGLTAWKSEEEFQAEAKQQTGMLLGHLKDALERNDADYFRKLSIAIESYGNEPIDRVRTNLLTWLFHPRVIKGQVVFPTLNRLVEMFAEDGIKIDRDQLRRTCRELGVKLKPVKTGRPKKSDN